MLDVYWQTNVPIYYAYIGLTDVNVSDFIWLDGSAVAYSNLSGKYLPLKLSLPLITSLGCYHRD